MKIKRDWNHDGQTEVLMDVLEAALIATTRLEHMIEVPSEEQPPAFNIVFGDRRFQLELVEVV